MTPGQATDAYRRFMAGAAQTVTVKRSTGAGVLIASVTCAARISGFSGSDVTGSTQQGVRNIIVLADDLGGFPLPFVINQDRIVWNGRTLVVKVVDDATRQVQGVIVAYVLTVEGA